jgi:lysophospholipase L1-like esterase
LEAGCLEEIFEGGAGRSRRLAGFYAATAERLGVRFLDAGTVIVSSPLDGVHFDADQHAKLGQAVAATVLAIEF